jgi:hypothetical protein
LATVNIEILFRQRSLNSFSDASQVTDRCLLHGPEVKCFKLGLAPWGRHASLISVCMGCIICHCY